MQRYDSPADAVPHEVNVLVLSETDACFGRPFESIFDELRNLLSCDKLLIEEYYHDLADLSDHELLIQHGVWIVHHSCLVDRDAYPELHHYLTTGSHPDGTTIVACVDPDVADAHQQAVAELDARYGDELAVVTGYEALVSYLRGFFDAASPCSQIGLEYIVRWNNDVCDDLEIV